MTGSVTGDVAGDVVGNLTGDVVGDVTGNITGDVNGNLTGDVLTSSQPNITSLGTLTSLTLGGSLVHSLSLANASDAGLTVPDGTTVYIINAGTETGNFPVAGPSAVAGQVLMIRNNTGQSTTGLAVNFNGGAIFVYDGGAWVKLAETN